MPTKADAIATPTLNGVVATIGTGMDEEAEEAGNASAMAVLVASALVGTVLGASWAAVVRITTSITVLV